MYADPKRPAKSPLALPPSSPMDLDPDKSSQAPVGDDQPRSPTGISPAYSPISPVHTATEYKEDGEDEEKARRIGSHWEPPILKRKCEELGEEEGVSGAKMPKIEDIKLE